MLSLFRLRRPSLVAVLALVAVASLTPAVAHAGDGHGGDGHGMDMDDDDGGHGNGGSGDGHRNAPTQAGAREIEVTGGRFRFKPDEITVAAGEDVTIVLSSTDLFHDFFVKSEGHIVGAKAKKTKKGGLTIDEPGTYKFWCTIEGHRAAGMKGTIVVQ
jgi:plastocyanin